MNCSTPGLPVHHQLPEFTQTHIHRVGDAIHPSHLLSSPFPPAPNPSERQSLFQWVNSLHEVAKVLELWKAPYKFSHCVHCFPSYLPWSDGTRCHDLHFLNVEFKPAFSLSCFSFIKRLFNSSFLSAIRVVSSAYLKLLIFLPEILIPACASSSPAFHMYSAYKLNKQGDSMQPWCTPFPIWNQSIVPCPVLTVASWAAYRFLRRQVRWSGIPISKNFPQFVVIYTVKGFTFKVVNEADAFLEFFSFFDDPVDNPGWPILWEAF